MKKFLCIVVCFFVASGVLGGLNNRCAQKKQLLENHRSLALALMVLPVYVCHGNRTGE